MDGIGRVESGTETEQLPKGVCLRVTRRAQGSRSRWLCETRRTGFCV